MKRQLRNITVPYLYFNRKRNKSYYVYKDKEYSDRNELFNDFIGIYLTYHYEVNDKVREVHNLSDVLEGLLKNTQDFDIPKKYKKEYSSDEYKYIMELKEAILNNELVIQYDRAREYKIRLLNFSEHAKIKFCKAIYSEYRKQNIPKKIYSEHFNNYYYVVAGTPFESIYHALDEVYKNNLTYEYGGTKNENNRSHYHSHSFDDLVDSIFWYSDKFKIHVFQQSSYSKQELEFLNALADKLKDLKFHSVPDNHDKLEWEEYCYLKDNHKIFGLMSYHIRCFFAKRKHLKEVLQSHKIGS